MARAKAKKAATGVVEKKLISVADAVITARVASPIAAKFSSDTLAPP